MPVLYVELQAHIQQRRKRACSTHLQMEALHVCHPRGQTQPPHRATWLHGYMSIRRAICMSLHALPFATPPTCSHTHSVAVTQESLFQW